MKKSWKLILIALLAALLVCTCMSAMAETETPGHGTWPADDPSNPHAGHSWTAEVLYSAPNHQSAVQNGEGKWGNWVEITWQVHCDEPSCNTYVSTYTERVFQYCNEELVDYKGATCLEEGYATYKCAVCGHEHTEVLKKLDHTPGEMVVVVAPTCTTDGYKAAYCTMCHYELMSKVLPALGHTMSTEPQVIKKPTCTEEGYKAIVCTVCGYEWADSRQTIKATGHSNDGKGVLVKGQAATCTKDGWKDYYQCETCKAVLSGKEVIPATGHHYVEADAKVEKPATCQDDGYAYATCNNSWCDAPNKQVKIVLKKLGHYYNYNSTSVNSPNDGWFVATAPTCQHEGYKVIACARCGGEIQQETLPKIDHNFVKSAEESVAANCAKEGKTVSYCSMCYEKKVEVVPKTAHKAAELWVYDRQAPTCTEPMKGELRCEKYANCKTVMDTVEIPATGHNMQVNKDASFDATCTVDGLIVRECINSNDKTGFYCNYVEREIIPAKGHDFEVETTPATCTTAGKEVKTCKVCGEVVTNELPALGHDYQTKTVAATCTTAGSETVACSRCGDVKSSKTIDALGHKAGEAEVTKAATCTEKGVKTTKCTVCGETLKTEEIAALSHKAGDPVVTAATCTKAGSKVTKCSVCGETLKTEEIPALGHKEEVTETAATCTKAGSKVTKCSVCGETLKTEEIPALGHKEEVTETAATCTEAGSKVTKCTVCGETLKTEEIPAPGHVPGKEKIEQNMGNTYCTVCGKLLKQRKISSGSSNSGSSAPVASAPVIYNGTINAVGIVASELGGNGSALVTPIDLSTDGTFTYSLVAGDKYVVGTLTVTVSGGKATVTYAVKTGVTVSAEGLSIFANAEALKAGTATTAAFNAEIDPAGDTKIILAVNLVGSFDVSIADAYTADAAQIATMKALVD